MPARLGQVLSGVLSGVVLLSCAAAQATPQAEQSAVRCIVAALNHSGWPTDGPPKPWGQHEIIRYTYVDERGLRSDQTIYVWGANDVGKYMFFTQLPQDFFCGDPCEVSACSGHVRACVQRATNLLG